MMLFICFWQVCGIHRTPHGQYQLECENVKVIYSLLRQAHVIYTKHMFEVFSFSYGPRMMMFLS